MLAQEDENHQQSPQAEGDFAALRHDPKEGVDFLQRWDREGRHNLCAKHPETGMFEGRSFRPRQWEKMAAFIESHQGWNVYWTANEPKTGAPHKKPAATDISDMRGAFIDCDPPEDLELAGKHAEARGIAEANATRAFTGPLGAWARIDTGGGFQCVWLYEKKLPAATNGIACEDQNRGLAKLFEADPGVTDVPRVLRLPGTVNWPDAGKRKRGRKPRQTSVTYRTSGGKFSLSELATIAPPIAKAAKSANAKTADPSLKIFMGEFWDRKFAELVI